ncbi:MAG: hypothetical protein A3B07_00790 [Candidatus Yonathbacteria bacterium RIFCSPLOWO2_01_FULL_43_27]|uniref:Serine protease n=2 Tax=Parcubacteria group TaxID=1794811 RepID=A0A1G2SDE4_9BACT|nr:MAG: hypothetical protein UW78_C0005G0022 [Candidatus Azambacteria bacterium GW2011_GWA1_44_9]OHA79079.1 MAG: hypothetical protein A2658_01980 [Candidatus Yonathbacteria bacterium RIFCSPHIGHO2_01_FULL_44_19]OHA83077.1 MAG: hypothetical protein A3B07_00790 [Candidatus Yonathbacteria bacterium RIFCSPLOWO2_01_FULL_43_27]
MEYLTRSQIILLALFVSFVSSMATGVVVVTLMQQSPEPVRQIITNVVEKTIEKVVPTIVEKPGKTVVVKDEDLMVLAIERNAKSVVAFTTTGAEGEIFSAGVGVIISKEGLIITDKANFNSGLLATTINDTKYTLEVVQNAKEGSLVLGKLVPATSLASTTPAQVFTPVTFGNPGVLKVGQTAIVIGGRDGKTVATGFINRLDTHTTTNKETKEEITILDNIGLSQRFAGTSNGAPIITLAGEVVGFVSLDEGAGTQSGVLVVEAQNLLDEASKSSALTPKL